MGETVVSHVTCPNLDAGPVGTWLTWWLHDFMFFCFPCFCPNLGNKTNKNRIFCIVDLVFFLPLFYNFLKWTHHFCIFLLMFFQATASSYGNTVRVPQLDFAPGTKNVFHQRRVFFILFWTAIVLAMKTWKMTGELEDVHIQTWHKLTNSQSKFGATTW